MTSDDHVLRLGVACVWDDPPEATWSHVPWHLRAALARQCSVADIDLGHSPALRTLLKASYARRRDGRVVSMWKHGAPTRRLNELRLRRADRHGGHDAILQFGDLGPTGTPFFLVQDLSYDVLLADEYRQAIDLQFSSLRRSTVLRLRDRQHRIYAQAGGVFALSQWLKDHLVSVSGLPAEKVHVVNPGINMTEVSPAALESAAKRRLSGPRRRLLFVGRDFSRKGGAEVLSALAVLRRDFAADVTLTVAGPESWPYATSVPEGVNFVGQIGPAAISRLYLSHDVFVLPSRFEAFGIVFAEALAHGLPCIGNDAYAMPEIIDTTTSGRLIASVDAETLARTIAGVLDDDEMVRGALAAAPAIAKHYNWDRAARQCITVMGSD